MDKQINLRAFLNIEQNHDDLKPIYLRQKKLKNLKQVNLRVYRRDINTRLGRKKEKFLKMKSKKLNDLSVSPCSNSVNSNTNYMQRDNMHYLDTKFHGFSLVESDDDSDSLASFNYPIQHSKIAFYDSLLSRKPSTLKTLNDVKQEILPKTGLESNTVAELTESTYESFFASPRKAKAEHKSLEIKHFACVPKKKKSKARTVGSKPTSFEDDSLIEKKIAPKNSLDRVEEFSRDEHSEEDAFSHRKERVRFEEKFHSGSFRNQNNTSFPNLFSSVSAGQKKNREVDLRTRDFFNNILQPKTPHMEKYNLKIEPIIKNTKIMDRRKKNNSIYNSIEFKFGHNEPCNYFDSVSSNYLNHSHHFSKANSHQSSDIFVLPNVLKSDDIKSLHYLNYQKRKHESLVFT